MKSSRSRCIAQAREIDQSCSTEADAKVGGLIFRRYLPAFLFRQPI